MDRPPKRSCTKKVQYVYHTRHPRRAKKPTPTVEETPEEKQRGKRRREKAEQATPDSPSSNSGEVAKKKPPKLQLPLQIHGAAEKATLDSPAKSEPRKRKRTALAKIPATSSPDFAIACIKIQRQFRRHIVRKSAEERLFRLGQKCVKIQRQFRGHIVRKRAEERLFFSGQKCVKIQRQFRGHLVRRHAKERHVVMWQKYIKIQSIARRWLALRRAQEWRHFVMLQKYIKIQSIARRWLALRLAQERRSLILSERKREIHAIALRWLALRQAEDRHDETIAENRRKYHSIVRRRQTELHRFGMNLTRNAIIIQCALRRWVVLVRIDRQNELQLLSRSAITLQCAIRCWMKRVRINRRNELQLLSRGAITLQCAVRRWMERVRVERQKELQVSSRCSQGRSRGSELEISVHCSAITVQRFLRGWWARRLISEQRHEFEFVQGALPIQRSSRQWLVRKKVEALRLASGVDLEYASMEQDRESYVQGALPFQRLARQYIARSKVGTRRLARDCEHIFPQAADLIRKYYLSYRVRQMVERERLLQSCQSVLHAEDEASLSVASAEQRVDEADVDNDNNHENPVPDDYDFPDADDQLHPFDQHDGSFLSLGSSEDSDSENSASAPQARTATASRPRRTLPKSANIKEEYKSQAAPAQEEEEQEEEANPKPGQKQETIAEQRGPFASVYPRHNEALQAVRCYAFPQKGRQTTQSEEKEESQEEKEKVYLMVGDKIRYYNHGMSGVSDAIILDFRRQAIVIGWKQGDLQSLLPTDGEHTMTLSPEGIDRWIKKKMSNEMIAQLPFSIPRQPVRLDGKTIMVRRDPKRSREQINSMRNKAEENRNQKKRPPRPPFKTIEVWGSSDVVHPFINIDDLPPEGRVLSDIPELRDPEIHYKEQLPALNEEGKTRCIFCPRLCDLSGSKWSHILNPFDDTKLSNQQKMYLNHVRDREKKVGGHPIPASQFVKELRWNQDEILTAKDVIQSRLQDACRSFPLVLSAACQAACDDPERRDDRDLKSGINVIFASALSLNREFQKIGTRGKKPAYSAAWAKWIKGIDPVLQELRERMLSFDFTVVLDTFPNHVPNTKGLMLWNYLNVFFLRGFYFEEEFPWTVDLTYDDKMVPPNRKPNGDIVWNKGTTDEQKVYWTKKLEGEDDRQTAII